MGDHARRTKGAEASAAVGAPGMETFWEGYAKAPPASLVDPRVPGTPPDPSALLPYIDHDADPVAMAAKVTAQLTESARRSTAFTDHRARPHVDELVANLARAGEREGRWAILNALDRLDDPGLREAVLVRFRAQTGHSLADALAAAEWHGAHDAAQATALISPERSRVERDIAGLSPTARAKLVADARTTATAIADLVGRDSAGDTDSARSLQRLLAQKTPMEIEALRGAVREQTRGNESLYEVIDRSLAGGDEDIAVASLAGDPVRTAALAIDHARGDATRIIELLRTLQPAQIASLQRRFPATALAWMSVPPDHQAEIGALVRGDKTAALGAKVADLLRDPMHGAAVDGTQLDAQSKHDREARSTGNVLRELAQMSPDELAKARTEWDRTAPARGEKTWDAMIEERFGAGDPLTYARVRALVAGNKVDATALALSQGVRDHDQATIDGALANPDLSSTDPVKRAAARDHARRVAARFQELGDGSAQAIAAMTRATNGEDVAPARGDTLDTALAKHHAYVARTPQLATTADITDAVIAPDEQAARRAKRARAAEIGTDELREHGVYSTATQLHRARERGDEARVATILEDQPDRAAVDTVAWDYERKYRESLFVRGDTGALDAYRAYRAMHGEDLSYAQAAYATRDSVENRVDAVRTEGPRAARSTHAQYRLDAAERDHQRSEDLAMSELVRRVALGRAAGADERHAWALANEVDALGGGRAEFDQHAAHARAMSDTQRDEKTALGERAAQWIAIAGKIAALVTLNPAGMAVIDTLVGFASIYVKSSTLGEAYTTGGEELLDLGLTVLNDVAMLPIGKLESTLARTAAVLGLTSATTIVRNDVSGRDADTTLDLIKNLLLVLAVNPVGDWLEHGLGGLTGKTANILVNTAGNGAAYGGDATTLLDSAGGHLAKKGARHTARPREIDERPGHHDHAPPHHDHHDEPTRRLHVPHPDVIASGHYAEQDDVPLLSRARGHDSDHVAPARPHQMSPEEQARRQAYFDEHGHTGSDLHSHFMGVPTVDDFARQLGRGEDGKGAPMAPEEMFQLAIEAVRVDPDYAKHYAKTATGDVIFDATGSGSDPVQGGHAFDNVYVLEEAKRTIDELRAQPPTPELDAQIREVARRALDDAFNSSQHTPYDGGYSIRDTMVKAYVDKQPLGGVAAYRKFTRMTLEALARDGVLYSEQSQSVKKLTKGNVPYEMVRDELATFNAKREERGEPPIDLRFLAMIETRFLGAEGAPSAGSEADWKAQLDAARELMKRGDVMGVDFASPETSDMGKGGKQLETRFEQLALMLAEQGKAAGRMLTLRPHVGEGYIEIPRDPQTGGRDRFDRDHGDAHYAKARSNLDALIANVDRLTKTKGPDGKPIYDPENPAFEIRFGHATHATPEQAKAMARLKIKVEVNLGSNAISGSLQDNKTNPQGRTQQGHLRSMDDHSLLTLAAAGVEIHLSTDAQAVMRTGLRQEYETAAKLLRLFKGDRAKGVRGTGTVRVTRETYLSAHPGIDASSVHPPYELTFEQLPPQAKQYIEAAHEKLVIDSMQRQSEVERGDQSDTRRGGM